MSVKVILRISIASVLYSLFMLGTVVLVVFILFGIFIYWEPHRPPSKFPEDQTLIALFSAHHEAFEKIRKMADEDRKKEMFISASDLTKDLSGSHQQEYNNLLPRLSSGMTVSMRDDGIVRFVQAHDGFVISSSWEKGIEYIPGNCEKHAVIIPNLDDVSKLGGGLYLRKLEPNWFLFYQYCE